MIGAAVAVAWAVVDGVVMAGPVGKLVMVVGPLPLPGHPEPGVHWAYQAFWVEQQLPAAQTVGPVHPFPPHCPQRGACWARALPTKNWRARERIVAEDIVET